MTEPAKLLSALQTAHHDASWKTLVDLCAQAAKVIESQQSELKWLRELTSVIMGVGDGSGKLFVYGDYDSIKACQAKLFENVELKAEVERLRAVLGRVASLLETQ